MYGLIDSYNYYPKPNDLALLMTELAEGLVESDREVSVFTTMLINAQTYCPTLCV